MLARRQLGMGLRPYPVGGRPEPSEREDEHADDLVTRAERKMLRSDTPNPPVGVDERGLEGCRYTVLDSTPELVGHSLAFLG